MSALEALDRKLGRVVTIEDWRRLGEKAAVDLSDDDLVVVAAFGGVKAAAAVRERRDLARSPAHTAEAVATRVADTLKQPPEAPRGITADELADIYVAMLKRATAGMQAKIGLLERQLAAREKAIDPTHAKIRELETILNGRICPRCRSGKR